MGETDPQPLAFLKSLLCELKKSESDFLSSGDLTRLGVKAFQVGLGVDEALQFNPCFFRPHPEKVFEKYPICPDEDLEWSLRDVGYVRTLEDFQAGALKDHSPEAARIEYNKYRGVDQHGNYIQDSMEVLEEFDTDNQVCSMWNAMDSRIDVGRQGDWPEAHIWGLSILKEDGRERWFPHLPGYQPVIEGYNQHGVPRWSVEESWRWMNHPHSTITCLVNAVYVSDTSQGLTVPELETIVTFLIRRTRHRPFRQCHIHPVLAIFYMGGQMARIVQASLVQCELTLQYSPCWSFNKGDDATYELFARYDLSVPVDGAFELPIR
ncbi:unnamed protein product [Penicillium olsonii]|nr:unnamed protein product [Penicillium olsonii]CAG7932414.1 unnamed protein product [Penicillium olsonii]